MGILDQISQSAANAGEYLTEKAVYAKDFALATMDIGELKSRINAIYKELGRLVYTAQKNQTDVSAEIQKKSEELDRLKAAMLEKEKSRNRTVCFHCDQSIDINSVFCPQCGAKIK